MCAWSSNAAGKSVCADCVEDSGLQDFVNANLDSCNCDYCGRSSESEMAADVNSVIEYMTECISREFTDPVEELPYDSESESGYYGTVLDCYDLLEHVGFTPLSSDLFDDVCEGFADQPWCRRDWIAMTPTERQQVGWQKFCKVVKHQRRFTFWTDHYDGGESEHHPDYLPPSMMLGELSEAIRTANLIETLPVGTKFWRLRVHLPDKKIEEAGDLTPPPLEFATQPNRMSPAGVPMFYGASDWDTCFAEVVDSEGLKGHYATGGQFQTKCEIKVLDLTKIPPSPSFFSDSGIDQQHVLSFLRYFTTELSKAIKRDQRQHIEYVPTQVFTEYVRYELARTLKHPIHGMLFKSSRNGGVCCVLFVNKEECLPPEQYSNTVQVLEFDPTTIRIEAD